MHTHHKSFAPVLYPLLPWHFTFFVVGHYRFLFPSSNCSAQSAALIFSPPPSSRNTGNISLQPGDRKRRESKDKGEVTTWIWPHHGETFLPAGAFSSARRKKISSTACQNESIWKWIAAVIFLKTSMSVFKRVLLTIEMASFKWEGGCSFLVYSR